MAADLFVFICLYAFACLELHFLLGLNEEWQTELYTATTPRADASDGILVQTSHVASIWVPLGKRQICFCAVPGSVSCLFAPFFSGWEGLGRTALDCMAGIRR